MVYLGHNAEASLFLAYCRAGGPTEVGNSAFLGRGLQRIRRRRVGSRAVGRSGAGRLYRVSHSDEVDVSSAQHFINSYLAPVLLFRWRLKSIADVLKGIRSKGFSQCRWDACWVSGMLYVVMVLVVRSAPCILGMSGSSPICTFFFKSGCLMLWIS